MSDRRTFEAARSAIFDMESEVMSMANLASCMRLLMQRDFGADARFEPAVTELAYQMESRAKDAVEAWQRAFTAVTGEEADVGSQSSQP